MAFEDYYALFNLPPKATAEQIRTAYRRLVLQYHPDRNPQDPRAENQFKQISVAYKVLSDEAERTKYDIRWFAFQDSQRIRRQNEEAARQNIPKPAEKKAPKERPEPFFRYRFEAAVLQQMDVVWGMGLGIFAALVLGTRFLPAYEQTPWSTLLAWSALVFPAVFLGQQVGAFVEDVWGNALEDDFPVWLQGASGFFPAIGAGAALAGTLVVYHNFKVPLALGGTLPAALGAGIAAFLGSSLGRAFLSVAGSLFGKLVGNSVAVLTGGGLALFLSPLFVLAFYGLWFNSQFFDALFVGASGGCAGGAMASFLGANRK